jgi:hypothetical protein
MYLQYMKKILKRSDSVILLHFYCIRNSKTLKIMKSMDIFNQIKNHKPQYLCGVWDFYLF